jgi:pimeloyl-ACP methyl ester carboxylesterase
MESFRAEDGARLAFRDQGEGLPVLALAGLTRDGRDFDYVARHLPPKVRLIRLDSRGRGDSDWTGPETYTVAQEARDALALLDHLGIARAAILGSSRGGLLAMVLATTAHERLSGILFNDVGPELERAGLERIGRYVGEAPSVATLEEIADRMEGAMPGFHRVPQLRWEEEVIRHYRMGSRGPELTYDPALKISLAAAMAAPPVDLWPLFDACAGLPLGLIRGANSDVLSAVAAEKMRARRPDMCFAEVPDRGHIPFLDEPEALACILAWLGDVERSEAARAAPVQDAGAA